jgi:hypothetical protein
MAPTVVVPDIPSTALVTAPPTKLAVFDKGVLSTAEVLARAHRIKEIQTTVMKPHVHFGTIPGTQKPTLYQPGADVLLVTFKIAPKVALIEDLSTDDAIRYRVKIAGVVQGTEEFLGDGVGECSSDEEKYRWRRVVCDEEWQETDPQMRRAKWRKGAQKPYKEQQIRTSPADVANTILKMAFKRAKIGMALSVTGAGDVFGQDLEDLADDLREQLGDADVVSDTPATPPRAMPKRKTDPDTPPVDSKQAAVDSKQAAVDAKHAAVETKAPAAETKAPAALHVAQVHTREHQGAPYYVVELGNGQKLSTRDDAVATAADTLVSRQVPVRLLTLDQAAQDAGVEGTAVLVYTPPPDQTRSPRLDRVIA